MQPHHNFRFVYDAVSYVAEHIAVPIDMLCSWGWWAVVPVLQNLGVAVWGDTGVVVADG